MDCVDNRYYIRTHKIQEPIREKTEKLTGLQRIVKEFSLLNKLFSIPLYSKSSMWYTVENSCSWKNIFVNKQLNFSYFNEVIICHGHSIFIINKIQERINTIIYLQTVNKGLL